MHRAQLIARKSDVQRQIVQTRRDLDRLQSQPQDSRRWRKSVERCQNKLEQLMGEEYNLRLRIDQAPR